MCARAVSLNRVQFGELEQHVDVLATRDPAVIAAHYGRLRLAQVRLSDREAWNFASTKFCVIIALTSALLLSTELRSLAHCAFLAGR